MGQLFALVPRYVDAPVDAQRVAAELHRAGDPGQGFTSFTTTDPRVERVVVGGCGDEPLGLLVRSNASGGDQPVDYGRGDATDGRHRNSVTDGHPRRRRQSALEPGFLLVV